MSAPIYQDGFRAAILALSVALVCAAEDALPESVRKAEYKGWHDSYILTSPEAKISVTIVPAVGGRILNFARNGESIIFETPGSDGKTLANTTTGFWVGGYNVDVGPEVRRPPDHKTMWMGPWQAEPAGPCAVKLKSEENAATGIQLSKKLSLDPKTGTLTLVQTMKNISDHETQYCLWDRTLCKGGGFCLIPLNKKSRFPKG